MSVSSRLRDLRVRARVRDVLIVKTLNKCILSSLVSNLVFDRQCMYFCTKPRIRFMCIKV